jgi:hypothetical protein
MKRNWDRSKREEVQFCAGEQVLVQAEYLPSARPSKKLDDKWQGPFRIIAKKGEVAYEVDLPPTWKGHQTINMSRLKKFVVPAFPGQPVPGLRPDPVLKNEGRKEYEVEEILDRHEKNKKTEYLVRWKDYGPEDDTWEPEENLKNAREALSDFRSRGRDQGKVGHHVTNVTVTASVTEGIKEIRERTNEEEFDRNESV